MFIDGAAETTHNNEYESYCYRRVTIHLDSHSSYSYQIVSGVAVQTKIVKHNRRMINKVHIIYNPTNNKYK